MKALILAAGLGSRLAPLTDTMPKAMVPVCGTPIIFQQIKSLREHGIGDITVVCGYRAEALRTTVHSICPDIRLITNAEYSETNNMFSAYLAREAFAGAPFLMMNGDVFFDGSVIGALLKFQSPDAIVVEAGRYLEESMKVVESGGRLTQISKQIPPEAAYGTSIDVYKFSAAGGKAFFDRCAAYIDGRKERKLWSEVALNDILPGQSFAPCPLSGRWLEIDNLDDLAAAEAIFGAGPEETA